MQELTYKHLLAEKASLEAMIANAKNPNSLSTASLSARLKKISSMIDDVAPVELIKKAIITFRGKPVHGSQSISADFSASALDRLANAVASIAASSNNTLTYHGAIPNKAKHSLQITGTAVGSFGFELSLPKSEDDLIDGQKNDTEHTLSQLQSLLQYGMTGTDEQISDLIEIIHPRAMAKVNDFLMLMQNQEALFALQFNDVITRVNDTKQLSTLIERFSQNNIRQYNETYTGRFIGVLPKTRTFEFQNDDKHIIKGKINSQVPNPEYINQAYLNKPTTVNFQVMQFGNAKPKYELMDISAIHQNPDSP
ncbi:hypothetical protein B0181_11705 [Moraxella caviae]|uniref:Uncharacterized protein n=1 Tax=Moraxella caviae TaxID=34060 RepID=A0A1S9ZS89_9GAMM|nr:hypothetical protein [Moraxella caviae]OOR86376.1 hypothetical protein B0181_11705 [Moraxella caviae]STZ14487.1 Uncharacterised protein [Moraxella caviae]